MGEVDTDMITFDQIKGVNERIKKIEVKGKAYACVPARVQAFRELFPDGSIETDILSMENGVVTMKAVVRDGNGALLSTGLAQEKESSSYINKTSFIENCETSAVGRALGFLGLGSDEQMASAEELANAVFNQNKKPGPKCEKCGNEIVSVKRLDGTMWPVDEMTKYSERRYGKRLCGDCMKAAEKAGEMNESVST